MANRHSQIGAGIDSFFEYAFKSYVLLSAGERTEPKRNTSFVLDGYYPPLAEEEHAAESFFRVWKESQASVKHHLYRGEGYQHPHFIQGDVFTGATRAFWIDSLSAYYPGLLTLAGEVEEATCLHLLPTALWSRFSGLPERWNVGTGNIEGGLTWWGGRPEFIESTYYLYHATKDPWYLYVGEMVLRDIKRRCWTECGLAGVQDVRTGELNDRMESFFLGETAKYMFLLYSPDHPLNRMDASFVFSTEGHPLIIPSSSTREGRPRYHSSSSPRDPAISSSIAIMTCNAVARPLALGTSPTAARSDLFHAASLARLPEIPPEGDEGDGDSVFEYAKDSPGIKMGSLLYPWTLPQELIPLNATSTPMAARPVLDINFPAIPGLNMGLGALERVRDGILIKTIGGLRLSMVREHDDGGGGGGFGDGFDGEDGYRVRVINNIPLGKDEKVYLSREVTFDILDPSDPNFTRVRDPAVVDIVIDVLPDTPHRPNDSEVEDGQHHRQQQRRRKSSWWTLLSSFLTGPQGRAKQKGAPAVRLALPATVSTGLGASPLPDVADASTVMFSGNQNPARNRLSWSTTYFADEICGHRIPREVVANHHVLVVKRGGCSFSQKLRNIAAYPPSRSSLKLVIVVSYEHDDDDDYDYDYDQPSALAALRREPYLVRPELEQTQMTFGGIPRRHLISMVMVGGGKETYELLQQASSVGLKRRYGILSQGIPINNMYIV